MPFAEQIERVFRHDVFRGLVEGLEGVQIWSGFENRPTLEGQYSDHLGGYISAAEDVNELQVSGSLTLSDVLLAGDWRNDLSASITTGGVPATITHNYEPVGNFPMTESTLAMANIAMDDGRYLIVVSSDDDPVDVEITGIPSDVGGPAIEDLFGSANGESFDATAGTLSFGMDSLGVVALRLSEADPTSVADNRSAAQVNLRGYYYDGGWEYVNLQPQDEIVLTVSSSDWSGSVSASVTGADVGAGSNYFKWPGELAKRILESDQGHHLQVYDRNTGLTGMTSTLAASAYRNVLFTRTALNSPLIYTVTLDQGGSVSDITSLVSDPSYTSLGAGSAGLSWADTSTVSDYSGPGTIGQVSATSSASGPYSIVAGNSLGYFSIDANSGEVSTTELFVEDVGSLPDEFALSVSATVSGQAFTDVMVVGLAASPDVAPLITLSPASVSSSAPVGTLVGDLAGLSYPAIQLWGYQSLQVGQTLLLRVGSDTVGVKITSENSGYWQWTSSLAQAVLEDPALSQLFEVRDLLGQVSGDGLPLASSYRNILVPRTSAAASAPYQVFLIDSSASGSTSTLVTSLATKAKTLFPTSGTTYSVVANPLTAQTNGLFQIDGDELELASSIPAWVSQQGVIFVEVQATYGTTTARTWIKIIVTA